MAKAVTMTLLILTVLLLGLQGYHTRTRIATLETHLRMTSEQLFGLSEQVLLIVKLVEYK